MIGDQLYTDTIFGNTYSMGTVKTQPFDRMQGKVKEQIISQYEADFLLKHIGDVRSRAVLVPEEDLQA